MCPAPWNDDPLPPEYQGRLENEEEHIPSYPPRKDPISHPPTTAPLCPECTALDSSFYDPDCSGCRKEIRRSDSTISQIFAILRQWVPQVQQRIDFLVNEAFRLGAHPDDRDNLTDMTLMMYVCKAGATGVGDIHTAAKVAKDLVTRGADLNLRCCWTNMTSIHYATYFDSGQVLQILLTASKGRDVDSSCNEFDNGTALHIAAANLSLTAAKVLLNFGADPNLLDDLARKPVDCIPDRDIYKDIPESGDLIRDMMDLLNSGGISEMLQVPTKSISLKTALQALGLKIGDRVVIGGSEKFGTLLYCGTTSFAPGVWVGVNLDNPEGKNDGSVNGVEYFKCNENHGIFVPPSKILKVGRTYNQKDTPSKRSVIVNHGKVKVSHVSSRLTEAIDVIAERNEIKIGDRVQVQIDEKPKKKVQGTVRFVGSVDFIDQDNENRWFGVELDEPSGRHNGTVQGVRYFASPPNHGIFVTEANLFKLHVKDNIYSSRLNLDELENIGRTAEEEEEEKERESLSLNYQSLTDTKMSEFPGKPVRRSLSTRHRTSRNSIDGRQSTVATPSIRASPAPSTILRSQSLRRGDSGTRGDSSGWTTVGNVSYNKFKKKEDAKYLEIGSTAICIHNKEMGVVKFVGRVHFASGIWVGMELRSPKGKHDGVVEGKRYFTTKANHGLMIVPKKLSVHGINAEKLLRSENEYPF